jgi:hypothetical protein
MPESTHDDRSWEAFRYVYGEMSETERTSFELRMRDDEALCDAVEQAVELTEAIRLSPPEAVEIKRAPLAVRRPRPAMHWAIAAAAVFAVGVGATAWLQRERPERAGRVADSHSPAPSAALEAGVSLAWADLHRHQVGTAADDWAPPGDPSGIVDLSPEIDDSAGGKPPQWLLTAVAGERPDRKEMP